MRRVLALAFALTVSAVPAFAQSQGTVNLVGRAAPNSPPTINTVKQLNDAVNNALAGKQDAGSGAGVSVIATGSIAARTLADRAAETKNVMDYGAVGDGVTNDTAAIRAANAAIPATGGTLYFPPGHTHAVTGTIYLKSNTHVFMYGTTLLALASWPVPPPEGASRYAFFENANYAATTLTDSNITVEGGTVDYGAFSPISAPGGGKHAIRMNFVNHVKVLNMIGQGRSVAGAGAEDFTAMIGSNDTLIQGNSAYQYANCPYDHWWGPKNARVIGNYAETDGSAQMVNFNPELTTGSSTGLVADGFVLSGNTFVGTGANAIPMQLEPLGAGTTAQNITVMGNTFKNVSLAMRRTTRGAQVAGNVFSGTLGGGAVIASYVLSGGTPDGIVITGNSFVDPTTVAGNQAVIQMNAINSSITGNTISGVAYYAATYTAAQPTIISGNNWPPAIFQNTGTAWVSGSTDQVLTQATRYTGSVVSVQLTGGSFQMQPTQRSLIVTPAGTIATFTLHLPSCTAALDGDERLFKSSQTITALTVVALAGSVVAPPTAAAIGTTYTFHCQGSGPTWY